MNNDSKGVIAWFVKNPVAANLLMIAIIVFGLYAVTKKIPLETFPAFETEVITISVSYPGATPHEVEQGIVLRVEDAIADLPGVDRMYGDASEGSAQVRVEVRKGYDVTKVLNEIKTRVDGISTFPDDAENPIIEQLIRSRDVITVIIKQLSNDEVALRKSTEMIRDEIRNLPGVTQLAMGGVRPWEISINVPEATLREYGLTLEEIAQIVRNSSRDIPGGTIKSGSGDILVRALGQAYRKAEFADITIISRINGSRVRLGDIADINDGFNEDPLYSQFDTTQAAFINISRVGDQNAIKLATQVKDFVEKRNETISQDVELTYWKDSSKIVKARKDTLIKSLVQGIGLVLLLLALFLRPDVGFWVSIGIPISFLGALATMPYTDVTLNLVSMFAFIIVLGIVVDDAIVTGENVYTHLQKHGDATRAAIEGTKEIAIPVTFGVLTTVAAFMPLMMIDGNRGKIFMQIPMIVIPVLIFSLIESKFVLPAHLRHLKLRKDEDVSWLARFQRKFSRGLEYFVDHFYRPFLEKTLNWRYLTVAVFVALLIIMITLVTSGRFKYTFFPRIQSEIVSATLQMPEGTPIEITEKYAIKMRKAAETMQLKYLEPETDEAIIQHILVTVGATGARSRGGSGQGVSHLASVSFETLPPESRQSTVTTREMVGEWRRLIGPVPGAKELSFRAELGRGGEPIDVQLAGSDVVMLNEVAEQVKIKLATYDGLFDIKNSFESGKTEVQLKILPEAEQLGLTLRDLGTQVRHAIYGAEVQRIQRNQSDVKVMVRYPKDERYSLSALQNLRIRTATGAEIPLSEVAEIDVGQGTSKISRVDRQRVIHVTSDIDKDKASANDIVAELKEWFPEVLAGYPGVSVDLEGEQREQKKFGQSLAFGFMVALITIYILLAIPFGSYFQPLMVMSIIPFSVIGAILGHAIMGISLSISSIMGLLALIGVVVNDSLVLVDYTNKRVKEGMPIVDAIRLAGGARFRPILLTSLTTFAGLTPLLLEKSTQAQFLIPMGVSLGFGILFTTLLTLILIPSFYLIAEDIKGAIRFLKQLINKLLNPQKA
ncbi:MAG: Acriflavin resistance protein [uncultured Thiotrichaceae bacterium]|uniref:Acriflavin resistance protein n=1 Tax=uncultured Thiotrichaceae bacterium TaxID=298394 RepID=A0A6S6SM01_9GAMM|nr:MAG: Acriflavin resistance protein [uncultured Thiotrichaceae bacterium]